MNNQNDSDSLKKLKLLDLPVIQTYYTNDAMHVFKSEHEEVPVVIKHATFGATFADINSIRVESNALLRAAHPHVVKLLSYQNDPYRPCLMLEYMAGGDLEYTIVKKPEQTTHWKALIAHDIVKALLYLHSIDMLHCDIKPGNVLLDETQTLAKLCDFGFSKNLNMAPTVFSQHAVGSHGYAGPELLSPRRTYTYSQKSDQYALGTLLYALFMWVKPYKDMSPVLITATIKRGTRPSLEREIDPLPESVKTLITRSWDMKPEERPSDQDNQDTFEALTKDFPFERKALLLG